MELYITSEDQATLYNSFRPSPPAALIERIINFLKEGSVCILDTAVDVGCGSGQSTLVLGTFFKSVYGIDNCCEQINAATRSCSVENIKYRLGSSDCLDFPRNTVQLVTAGQCAHLFEINKFYQEVGKILQVNGVLAIYGYCLPVPIYENISLEYLVKNLYGDTINKYVSEGSKLVYLKNYKTKDFEKFPFSDQPFIREEFDKTLENASLKDLLGYMESWSGFQRLKRFCGDSVSNQIICDFKNEVLKTIHRENDQPDDVKLTITFKYFLLLGRKVEKNIHEKLS